MSLPQHKAPRPLPTAVKIIGSVIAVGHLAAVALLAMGATSGPWLAPPPIHASTQEGPLFAKNVTNAVTYPFYLRWLRMTHNYHFDSNRPQTTDIAFDVILKDADGNEIGTPHKFPDPKANGWVRHRQTLLANGLGNDQPVQRVGPDKVGPANPDQKDRKDDGQPVWTMSQPGSLKLIYVPEHLAADRGSNRPSDLALMLAKSYARHLCRKHNAASAEIVRRHRDGVTPAFWLIPNDPPPDNFLEIKSHFGEFGRE